MIHKNRANRRWRNWVKIQHKKNITRAHGYEFAFENMYNKGSLLCSCHRCRAARKRYRGTIWDSYKEIRDKEAAIQEAKEEGEIVCV